MRTILWRRLDVPGADAAKIIETPVPTLEGTAVFAEDEPCRLDYLVRCDAVWHTVSARVTGWIGDRTIDLTIAADKNGRWTANGTESPAIGGCVDVDLSFTPMTNMLPIRRLRLKIGDRAPVRAAWLRFPECLLEPLEQVYERIDSNTYRYESDGGSFVATLKVDASGLVTGYENLWSAEGSTS